MPNEDNEELVRQAIEQGLEVYGRMLDLENAHIEDAIRTGMRAAVEKALEIQKQQP